MRTEGIAIVSVATKAAQPVATKTRDDAIARGSSMLASTDDIRSHFPALARRHGGRPVAYFDGPGGTQVPRQVVAAMTEYLFHHNANTHWAFPTSRETDDAIAAARQTLADFLNASPAEVAFGANMTTLTFHLARALGDAGDPATRSWSRNWTTTPTSTPGGRWSGSGA